MKRRLTPILTIGIALILIGSLAYAADRRKQTKGGHTADPAHEEEAFRAELLEAVEGHEKKSAGAAETGKIAGNNTDKKTDQAEAVK